MTEPNTRVIRVRLPGHAHTAALKAAVRDTLRLNDEQTVVIRQVACTDPGCPPVETVIAVLSAGAPSLRWTVPQALADLTPEAIRIALSQAHPN